MQKDIPCKTVTTLIQKCNNFDTNICYKKVTDLLQDCINFVIVNFLLPIRCQIDARFLRM